jgi:hypothetical protein
MIKLNMMQQLFEIFKTENKKQFQEYNSNWIKNTQADDVCFKGDYFIIKVNLVLLVSQHQSSHFLITHHAQMSLPGGITHKVSVSVQAVASRKTVLLS